MEGEGGELKQSQGEEGVDVEAWVDGFQYEQGGESPLEMAVSFMRRPCVCHDPWQHWNHLLQ